MWDFWIADDMDQFHLFYLFAPKSLVDPHLRHRNARIGHATSPDLRTWEDHGEVLGPGRAGAFDETATWTGSVVRGDDGMWRMFYTGSVFESTENDRNVESIGVAISADLFSWAKSPNLVIRSDPRWYESLGDSSWPEEAWRDPWVFGDPDGDGWHMLITARGRSGAMKQRGVIGHARSEDLEIWEVQPPLTPLATGFAHLEVPQIVKIDGRQALLFPQALMFLRTPIHGAVAPGCWTTCPNADPTM
ncbi:glycosyl hydrolase family 32 [Arthrobacter sp. SA17]